jgi:hypothetical protein
MLSWLVTVPWRAWPWALEASPPRFLAGLTACGCAFCGQVHAHASQHRDARSAVHREDTGQAGATPGVAIGRGVGVVDGKEFGNAADRQIGTQQTGCRGGDDPRRCRACKDEGRQVFIYDSPHRG